MGLRKTSGLVFTPAEPAKQLPETALEIVRELTHATDAGYRARLLKALVLLNSVEAASALSSLVAHADAALRSIGVEGLRQLSPVVARPALAALLADPSPDIRIRALDVVDHVPDAEVETWLIALLEREDHANVCGAILEQLAEIGTGAALPAIRAAKLRFATTPFITFSADIAVAQITGA
jgi:HEAT repeat protein